MPPHTLHTRGSYPPSHDSPACAATLPSLLCMMHVGYYCGVTSGGSCAAAAARISADGLTSFAEALQAEMVAQTPQGAMSAGSLVLQVLVACACIHIVIDRPRPVKEGELWGPTD